MPRIKWTYEKCKEVALLCESRKEFHSKYRTAFDNASKNKWIDEFCSHMKPINDSDKCVYVYEFDDNCAYVGITWDLKDRHRRHMKNGPVKNHMLKSGITPIMKQLTDFLMVDDAKTKECDFLNTYKKNGWIMLNKAITGSIGSSILFWTKEKCQEVALKCKNKTEFWKKYPSASNSARKNKWLDEICSHMENKFKKKGYWNYENCLKEAKKLNSKTKFNQSPAYKSATRNNWLDKIYHELNWVKTIYINKDDCKKEAFKYDNKKDFRLKSPKFYEKSIRNGWMDEICSHMIKKKIWTKKECLDIALMFKTKKEFRENHPYLWYKSYKEGWLEEITSHLKSKKSRNYWTKEKCHEESLKFNRRGEFQKKSKVAYQVALKNKWLDEICSHMK